MRYRTLGRTGIQVSELGLGGLFVSRIGGDRSQATAAVHRALELGVNWVDTAPTYADSEEVLGAALRGDAARITYRPNWADVPCRSIRKTRRRFAARSRKACGS